MVRSFCSAPVSDREYLQRVRRHPPSSLLRLIARVSSQMPTKIDWPTNPNYRPWALADAAMVSLVRSNEHRRRPASDEDLVEILAQYLALDDPIRHLPVGERLEGYLLRVAGQQFTWQEDDFSELARSLALLIHTEPTKQLEVLTDGWEQDLLGCSLSDYVGLGQLLYTAAINRQGRFDWAWLPEHELTAFGGLNSHAVISAVIERHFATGAQEERALAAAAGSSDPLLRRYTPNRLRSRPLVRGYGCDYLIPVTPAVLGKVSPMGLYYTARDHYQDDEVFLAFTRDLGELFEQYVGRNLGLLPDSTVYPEIVYGKENRKSVDWIVVLPDLVLLVEAKAARPTTSLRLGPQDKFSDELNLKVGKAVGKQIPNTVKCIRDRTPEFAHIPHDLPMFGIVVTMEPYHWVNAPEFRSVLPPDSDGVSTVIASAGELEDAVVSTGPSLREAILGQIDQAPPGGWSLRALTSGRTVINPILDAAWSAFPWGDHHATPAGDTATGAS
ncbi:hypothetical protein [Streptomyces sp. BF23-19]|uniref:hypothetical protein n=1 Tax=unclassified Streptomyces TaxID=2593676 RepID=UPI0034E50E37